MPGLSGMFDIGSIRDGDQGEEYEIIAEKLHPAASHLRSDHMLDDNKRNEQEALELR